MPSRTFTKEADVKEEMKKIMKRHQWHFWMPPGNGYGTPGVSDFNATRWKTFMAAEVKFGKRKPTVPQLRYLKRIAADGHIAIVVNEKSLDAFEELCGTWQWDHPLDYIPDVLRPDFPGTVAELR